MKTQKLTFDQLHQDLEVLDSKNLNGIKGGQQDVTYNGGTLQEVTIVGTKNSSADNSNFFNFNRYNTYGDAYGYLSTWVNEGNYGGGGGGYANGFSASAENGINTNDYAKTLEKLLQAIMNLPIGSVIDGGKIGIKFAGIAIDDLTRVKEGVLIDLTWVGRNYRGLNIPDGSIIRMENIKVGNESIVHIYGQGTISINGKSMPLNLYINNNGIKTNIDSNSYYPYPDPNGTW